MRDTNREAEFEAERVRLGEVALELTRQREHFEKEVGLAREAYQAFHAEKEALRLEKEQFSMEKEALRLERERWEQEGKCFATETLRPVTLIDLDQSLRG